MEADNSCRKMGKQLSASIQIKDNELYNASTTINSVAIICLQYILPPPQKKFKLIHYHGGSTPGEAHVYNNTLIGHHITVIHLKLSYITQD